MKTYNLTPQQFEQAKAAVQRATGEVLPAGDAGHHGTITHEGVTLDYTYDGKSKLDVAVTHKPFIISTRYLEGKLDAWFKA